MPIGGKPVIRLPVVRASPEPPVEKVYIRLPRTEPVVKLVPAIPRSGSLQRTCIRYDANGQWFVDEFVERSSMHGVVNDDRRNMRILPCPKFNFQIAIACCHHYCYAPCTVHVDAITQGGWYERDGKPLFGNRKTRLGMQETKKREAEGEDDD